VATLKEVAKKAGVSITTASKILNDKPFQIPISEETKKKVLKVAEKLNYYPNIFARSLRTRKTGIVGVIVSDITDPYFGRIIDGIEKVLNESDYYFLLSSAQNSPRKEELYLSKLRKSRVDGLLILGGTQRFTDSEVKQLVKSGIPIVVVGRKSPHLDISSVTVDNFTGGFAATEHLIKLGHSDIVHITTRRLRVDGEERLNGYKSAMEKHGLKDKCRIEKGDITAESGYKAMTNILKKGKRPTAIFAFNDMSVLGVIRAIRDQGLCVPRDIAVVGFDDISIAARCDPPLTTVRQPRSKMGKVGAELLMRALSRKSKNSTGENVVLKPKLIIRKSCAAVR
jgi:LacI family transcriptional regulator